MLVTRPVGTRDEAHLSGWHIIVSDRGGYMHVLFKPPASGPIPNWIRIASTESPLDSEAHVPAHVLRHGMVLLHSAEGHERAALAGAPPMVESKPLPLPRLKKFSTPSRKLEQEIREVLSSHTPRRSKPN